GDRHARADRHAVVAALAEGRDLVTGRAQRVDRKALVLDLGLLQAQDVGLFSGDPREQSRLPRADRIDVPGRELHEREPTSELFASLQPGNAKAVLAVRPTSTFVREGAYEGSQRLVTVEHHRTAAAPARTPGHEPGRSGPRACGCPAVPSQSVAATARLPDR